MRVEYAEPIAKRLYGVVMDARKNGKTIERIVLTPDEWRELKRAAEFSADYYVPCMGPAKYCGIDVVPEGLPEWPPTPHTPSE